MNLSKLIQRIPPRLKLFLNSLGFLNDIKKTKTTLQSKKEAVSNWENDGGNNFTQQPARVKKKSKRVNH
jgi:hypothetical protein